MHFVWLYELRLVRYVIHIKVFPIFVIVVVDVSPHLLVKLLVHVVSKLLYVHVASQLLVEQVEILVGVILGKWWSLLLALVGVILG